VAADAGFGDDLIYTSTNSGTTWNARTAPTNQWAGVASSADGTKLVAVDSGYGDGLIYVSTDAGATWAAVGPVEYWTAIASSADGSILTATANPGGIYTWQASPMLSITPSSGNVIISWQSLSSAAGCVLQGTSNLKPTNWLTVTNLPVLTNGLNQVVVPVSPTSAHFYRLESP
jgi:hypothetical protein